MTISSLACFGFAALVGIAGCNNSSGASGEDKEKSAKCTDRTNNISCAACCQTEDAVLVNNLCACKGKPSPPVAPK